MSGYDTERAFQIKHVGAASPEGVASAVMEEGRQATVRRPRRADAERNRRSVLRAANEVFARRGMDASIPDVAARAGVGVGTVYRSFPTKRHLLGAIVAERFRWFEGQVHEALDAPEAWPAFEQVVWKGAAAQVKDRAFHQLIGHAADLPDVRRAREAAFAALQRLVARAQAEGTMRADVTAEDMPTLLAGVGYAQEGPAACWERHLAVVLDGLRAEGARPLPCEPLSPARLDAIVAELPCPR